MTNDPKAPLTDEEARFAQRDVRAVEAALAGVVIGQDQAVRELCIGLFADGHVLLEGVPGVAKTLLARTLASALDLRFHRVQFTPDLMPTDLIGTRIWNPETRAWELHTGPIFTDVLLADEINRTPPKTQAALLEGMEERQVTIDTERHSLGESFFVVATENPLEFEGTYPLPEAQTDRFLLKIVMGYPPESAELELYARGVQHGAVLPRPVLSRDALAHTRALVARTRVDSAVRGYALALVRATRSSGALRLGASPRAGMMLLRAAQVCAVADGRAFTLPDDVKAVARPVLRHRLALSTEAELDGLDADRVLTGMLDSVAVLAPAS
ncbi:MAG: MoxR family ATPase [Deltaproteobacteria bacterium]|nr:MoxR family ATPase [Deltaproteobacteria bacterium]